MAGRPEQARGAVPTGAARAHRHRLRPGRRPRRPDPAARLLPRSSPTTLDADRWSPADARRPPPNSARPTSGVDRRAAARGRDRGDAQGLASRPTRSTACARCWRSSSTEPGRLRALPADAHRRTAGPAPTSSTRSLQRVVFSFKQGCPSRLRLRATHRDCPPERRRGLPGRLPGARLRQPAPRAARLRRPALPGLARADRSRRRRDAGRDHGGARRRVRLHPGPLRPRGAISRLRRSAAPFAVIRSLSTTTSMTGWQPVHAWI